MMMMMMMLMIIIIVIVLLIIRYRTLVMAMREFTEKEWSDLEEELHTAEITIENREEAVNKAYVMNNPLSLSLLSFINKILIK